ncbi:MAG: hypothetical protein K6346_02990 [Halothiobacillaceae bacterium]
MGLGAETLVLLKGEFVEQREQHFQEQGIGLGEAQAFGIEPIEGGLVQPGQGGAVVAHEAGWGLGVPPRPVLASKRAT